MDKRQALIASFEEEVASGKLTKTVIDVDTNHYAVRFHDAKTDNIVGYFNNRGYWSTCTYNEYGYPVDRNDSCGRWLHANYSKTGELESFADQHGTWQIVVPFHPLIAYNSDTDTYRHHLGSNFKNDSDIIAFVQRSWSGWTRDAAIAKISRHFVRTGRAPFAMSPNRKKEGIIAKVLFTIGKLLYGPVEMLSQRTVK